jgi:hypothetical protein
VPGGAKQKVAILAVSLQHRIWHCEAGGPDRNPDVHAAGLARWVVRGPVGDAAWRVPAEAASGIVLLDAHGASPARAPH